MAKGASLFDVVWWMMGVAKRMEFLSSVTIPEQCYKMCYTCVTVVLLGWVFWGHLFVRLLPLSCFFGSAGATTWLELHLAWSVLVGLNM
jgi:hypothetical protein